MKPIIRILGIAMVLALGLSQPLRAEVPKFIPSRSHCTDPKLVHVPQKLTPAQCDKWFKFETKHAKNLILGYDGRLYLAQPYGDASTLISKLTDAEFAPRKNLLAENLSNRINDLILHSDASIDREKMDYVDCKFGDTDCMTSNMVLFQKILAGQCNATDNIELRKICETAKQNGNLAKLSDWDSHCTIAGHSFRGEHSCLFYLKRLDLPFGNNLYSSREASGGTCGDNYIFYGPADAQGQRVIFPDGQLCLVGEVFFRFAIGQAVPDILLPFYNQTVVLAWQKTGAGSWVSIGKIDDPFSATVGDFDYATQTKVDIGVVRSQSTMRPDGTLTETKVDRGVVLYRYRNIQKRLVDILGDQYEKFEYGFGEWYNERGNQFGFELSGQRRFGAARSHQPVLFAGLC